MENRINIAELLKNCPKGMELDCILFNNPVTLDEVADIDEYSCPITVTTVDGDIETFTKYGQYLNRKDAKCIIFPKGKTTWEGFVPPCRFKDGDVIFTTLGNIAIIRKPIGRELFSVYGIIIGNCLYKDETIKGVVERHATEEEKQKLFDVIKENGYEWNADTKTLEKLIEPKFKVGDIVQYITDSTDRRKIEEIDILCNMYHTDSSPIMFEVEDEWKSVLNSENVEQNLADKVEPKFHKGDWIVFNGLTLYVKEVVKGFYRTISKGGISNSYDWDIDKIARFWTIQDAKDGDVLAEDSCIFIIQKIGDNCTAAKTHCTLYDDGDFDDGSILYFDIDSTKPATKEQCDLLFTKMKKAGYKWNIETKTLDKLVEPKFKVGDRVKSIYNNNQYDIIGLTDTHYTLVEVENKFKYTEPIIEDKNWELVPKKFDITTLKPFDKVLVRLTKDGVWNATFFSHYDKEVKWGCYPFVTTSSKSYSMCIPYNEDTKHLTGTTNDCDDYYKIWK